MDIRHALRALARRPAFTLAAVLSLSIGIGASTIVFGLANTLLIRTVPGVVRPQGIVELAQVDRGDVFDLPWHAVRQLREERAILADLAAFALAPVSVAVGPGAEPVVRGGLAVDGNYFDVLGVRPASGRGFSPDEAGFPRVAPVALVSHHFWERHLDGRADAVGRSIRVNGVPVEVAGVLPPGFAGHRVGLVVDVFLPLGLRVPGLPSPDALNDVRGTSVEALGRLAPGVSLGAARAALSAAGERWRREQDPAGDGRFEALVSRWGPLPAGIRGNVAAFLAVLSALVGLALAMACVNVTTVLLARATERQRELAVRQALGATRSRLTRQLVTEAVVLFALAGVAATLAVLWAGGLLRGFSPQLPIPGRTALELSLDWRVLAFAVLATFGTGILFSLAPALRASRLSFQSALKAGDGGASGRSRLRAALVGVQVGATTLLLLAAAVLVRAAHRAETLDPGFSPGGVTVAEIDLQLNGTDRSRGQAFYRELHQRVSVMPGIESAALATKLPLGGRSSFGLVTVAGVEPPAGRAGFEAYLNRVSPGYFRTLGIALLRGRDVGPGDGPGAPLVAVVNETMASRLWPGRDPVGAQFRIGTGENVQVFEVIGVAADLKQFGRLAEATPSFYYVSAAPPRPRRRFARWCVTSIPTCHWPHHAP
jgi:predicted permease